MSSVGAGGPAGAQPGAGSLTQGAHKSTTIRGSFMRSESAGLSSGCNYCAGFDSEALSVTHYDGVRNPLTGNAPDRPMPHQSVGVTSKGHKMQIC